MAQGIVPAHVGWVPQNILAHLTVMTHWWPFVLVCINFSKHVKKDVFLEINYIL